MKYIRKESMFHLMQQKMFFSCPEISLFGCWWFLFYYNIFFPQYNKL